MPLSHDKAQEIFAIYSPSHTPIHVSLQWPGDLLPRVASVRFVLTTSKGLVGLTGRRFKGAVVVPETLNGRSNANSVSWMGKVGQVEA